MRTLLVLCVACLVSISAVAQTASADANGSDPKADALLKQMVTALGGDKWLAVRSVTVQGKSTGFYNGKPTGVVGDYWLFRTMPSSLTDHGQQRTEFTKKRNVVNILSGDKDWEVTYKGKRELPPQEYGDAFRRRDHSLESVVRFWWHAPGTILFASTQKMVERHLVDEVTMLDANNDNVTLALDSDTHLPVQLSFKWRNTIFKDEDEDGEDFADYHPIDGIQTPLNVTLLHNGDMTSQRYITKVQYDVPIPADAFDPDATAAKLIR